MEVLISPLCTESFDTLEKAVLSFLETSCMNYCNGPIVYSTNAYLMENIKSIKICDVPKNLNSVPFWKAELCIHIYTLNAEGSAEESLDGNDDVTAYSEWMLPCSEFESLWDQ